MLRKVSDDEKQSGQSLLEVLMVAFILVMALVALISLTTVSIARNRLAKERTVAVRLAQESLEWFKYERDRAGFDAIALKNSGDYCLSEFPSTAAGGIEILAEGVCGAEDWVNETDFGRLFMRTLQLSSLTPDDVKAIVVVDWRGESIRLEGAVTRWER